MKVLIGAALMLDNITTLETVDKQRIEAILIFWFGRIPDKRFGLREMKFSVAKLPYWGGHFFDPFQKADNEIRSKFNGDLENASNGKYDSWEAHPIGRLALIILLDQFPRNIHRGTAKAFSQDKKVFELAIGALDSNDDHLFDAVTKHFFYLPLMHKEDLSLQNRCVSLYRKAIKDANYLSKPILTMDYMGALRHRQIIKKFGRFPHRNKILGRDSTPQESTFLRQPFSSF